MMHFDIKKSIHIFILSMITPSNGNIIKDTGFSLSMTSTGTNGQVNKSVLSGGWLKTESNNCLVYFSYS